MPGTITPPVRRARAAGAACATLLCAACAPDAPLAPGSRARPPATPSANTTAGGQNTPVTLKTLWRLQRPTALGTDMMTSSDPGDLDWIGPPGSAFAVSYVPAAWIGGTTPLFRLLSPDALDHMDSPLTDEGGYRRIGAVGFPWTSAGASALPGMTQLMRQYREWDHALTNEGEVLPGYSGTEYLHMYGYRRYGRTDTAFATLAAGGVTIRSNLVAGCSLWSWEWQGVEFVNAHDFGRQIQTALGFDHGGIGVNPTEAGSTFTGPERSPVTKQGSPCLGVTTVDASGPSPTQRTRAIPLEWQPQILGGGSANPVAWPHMQVGKDITLNYAGLGPVARYTTVITVPAATPAGVEVPSVYLNGGFRALSLYDAQADAVTPLSVPCEAGDGAIPASGFGGVIASTDDGSLAFGIYGVTIANGGSVSPAPGGFSYFRFYCGEPGSGPADNPTTKIRALNQRGLAAGENRFTTYLVSGTRADVRRLMRRLYEVGAR